MTNPPASISHGKGAARLLLALGAVVVAVALFTPENAGKSEGGRSSYSTAPGGIRMAYELAQRTGWRVERRITPLDSVATETSAQVVIEPRSALGAHEVHRLLENVRRGGGLIVSFDGADDITDSLGVDVGPSGSVLENANEHACDRHNSLESRALAIPPDIRGLVWKPKPAGLVTVVRTRNLAVAQGFPLGQGRIVVVSESSIFSNDAVRVCRFAADLAVARILEYVKPTSGGQSLVFDEFHHGFGIHSTVVKAVWEYVSDTASGHFFAQLLLAGALLLLAVGPRPLPPTDPERVARRSPLEHADALAQAYADVDATRTATERLVSGLRRRVGRTVAIPSGANDTVFLDGVVQRDASLASSVQTIRRALGESVPAGELNHVGEAIGAIERQLMKPPQQTQ